MTSPRELDPESLFSIPHVFDYGIAPSGDLAAFSWNKTGQWEIYSCPLPGGKVRVLTRDNGESKIAPQFDPKGRRLAYAQDYGGDEKFDIFILDLQEDKTQNITPETDYTIYPHIRWSPDGRRVAFASNRHGRFGVYTAPSLGGPPELVSDDKFDYSKPEWSPDGRRLAFDALVTAQSCGVFIAPSGGGEILRLMDGEKAIDGSEPQWAPDGRSIVFMSSELGGSDIGIWHLEDGTVNWLTDGSHECYSPAWHPDGNRVAYLVNLDGNIGMSIRDTETNAEEITGAGRDHHSQVRIVRGRALFIFSEPRHPPDLWTVDLRTRKLCQVTDSLLSTIDSSLFVTGSTVRYPSRDGLEIPALLYLPKRFDPERPGASLVYVHGGPMEQQLNEWYPSIQYLVSRGYVVIAPNYRGSSGFGRKFREANRFVLGEKDLDDVVAAADYLTGKGLTDPGRIGIMGASYGGYLTMCALTHFPRRWAAGVAVVPFLNWFTEIENERGDLQFWDRENMGDPKIDYERFRSASPIFFIDRIEAPVMLVAGANDPRCPASETRQAQRELQRLGKVFELVVYEAEGHGSRKTANRVDAYKKRVAFLSKYLAQ